MKVFGHISLTLSVIVLIIASFIMRITSINDEDFSGWGLYFISFIWGITALCLIISN